MRRDTGRAAPPLAAALLGTPPPRGAVLEWPPTMIAVVLALVGAVLIGTGSARQHAVAVAADPHAPMDPRLIMHLARRSAWLIGNLMAFGGFLCIASAIATGRLVV